MKILIKEKKEVTRAITSEKKLVVHAIPATIPC